MLQVSRSWNRFRLGVGQAYAVFKTTSKADVEVLVQRRADYDSATFSKKGWEIRSPPNKLTLYGVRVMIIIAPGKTCLPQRESALHE